jgi:hypothetical protein
MTTDRRNHYRVLHVQPEAPPEVIKASWRALMGSARLHPDLGGDHAAAARINEAYRVLADPERRRAYDRLLDVTRLRSTTAGGPVEAGAAASVARPGPRRVDPAAWRSDRCCPMCRSALPAALRADTRCARCDAPLAPVAHPGASERELFGRRAVARRSRSDGATVFDSATGPGIDARLVDLSTGGAGLVCAAALPPGAAIRVVTPTLDAVARVVACSRLPDCWRARLQWLTARPLGSRGVYVSVSA